MGVIVTRNFRPKPGHLNEKVYCKAIDRKLSTIPEFWKIIALE